MIFFLLIIVLILITKQKAKSVLISAFVSIILVAVSLVVPIENAFYSFKSVEDIFAYRYHEELLTYAECDEGVAVVAQKDGLNFRYYAFSKDEKGYKLPENIFKEAVFRSSEKGVFIFEKFDNQTIIITQVKDSAYNGKEFTDCKNGYYTYTVVEGPIDYSALTCAGDSVKLV